MLYDIVIIAASFIGFLISSYLWHKKTNNKKPICFIGNSCGEVIYSSYSKTFGIENEILGMIYYGLIFLTYSTFVFLPISPSQLVEFGLFLLTLGAALFSIYLLFIQGFVLKAWCEWCITTAIASIIIFVFTVL